MLDHLSPALLPPARRVLLGAAWLLACGCGPGDLLIGSERAAAPSPTSTPLGGQGGGGGHAGGGDAGQSGGAGTGGAADRGPIDTIIDAMPPNSWKELPGTRLDQVCPPPANFYACKAVFAWSGGAFDDTNDRLIVFGGGYDDSFYNNVFAFDLASISWKRWTELPAGLASGTPTPVFLDKRIEPCGLYPAVDTLTIPDAWLTPSGYLLSEKCEDPSIVAQLDPQQPRSNETHGNLAFSHATGRFYLLGSVGQFTTSGGSARVTGFDFATGQWVRGADNARHDYGSSATDAAGTIWYVGTGTSTLSRYDPVADAWTVYPSGMSWPYYESPDVDRLRNLMVETLDADKVTTYDLSHPEAPPQSPATSGAPGPIGGQAPGFAYVDSLDRFAAWSGGQTVRWLDPATWAWKTLIGTGDDPGAATPQGTYGRFRYSQRRKVLVVINSSTTSVFLFKPPATAP